MTAIMATTINALVELFFEVVVEDTVDVETVLAVVVVEKLKLDPPRTLRSGFNASEAFPR